MELWYLNTETGVLVNSRSIAMSWFIGGTTVTLLQNKNGEWTKAGNWER